MGGLSPNMLVLMNDGTHKQIKNVVIDDNVMGPDSKPRKVAHVYSGIDTMYIITTEKGQTFTCSGKCLLVLTSHVNDERKLLSVEECDLLEDNNWYLLNVAVEFPEIQLEDSLEEILQEVTHNVGSFIRSNDYIDRPRIPPVLLRNTMQIRTILLYGLLHYMNKYLEFHEIEIFHNDGLVCDLEDLCLSLGIIVARRQRRPAQVHSYTLRIHIRPLDLRGNIINPDETQQLLITNRKQKFSIRRMPKKGEYYGLKLEYTDNWDGNYLLSNYLVAHT